MKGNLQHLLVVSEDQEFCLTLEQLLCADESGNYNLSCVYPLEKALDLLDQNDFSLVVFDLPNDTACSQVAEQVRNAFGKLPIILLSSSGYQQAIDAIHKGIQQVMDKSRIDNEIMLQVITASIERSRIENELRMHDAILGVVNYAAEVFLMQANWNMRLGEILERLAGATGSDRVFICQKKQADDNQLTMHIRCEWCDPLIERYAGHHTGKMHSFLQNACHMWMGQLSAGLTVFADREALSAERHPLLEELPVQSIIMVPIFNQQDWWGVISIEHCHKPKHWSVLEIDAIQTAATMIGAAIGRQLAEEKMEYLATHDYLTNLPNRLLFADRFQHAISHAARSRERVGIICLDLDQFKCVNDAYGHQLGDRVLIQVGARLSGSLRTSDTCARIGGDEFGFIADSLKSENDLSTVMQKLQESLREEFILEGKAITVTASMGASLYPEHGSDLEELMTAADKALYQVKSVGNGWRIFRKGEQYSLLQE